MHRKKLNYRFHNPNSEARAADYILELFMEVNELKVEQAVKRAAEEKSAAEHDNHDKSENDSMTMGM